MKLKSILNFCSLAFFAVAFFISCSPLDPKPDFSKGFIKFFTGVDYTYSSQLILTQDGGYAMVGSGLSNSNLEDIYVVKADSKGNKIWDKYLGSADGDTGYSIKEDANQNLIVLGVSNNALANMNTIYLAKLEGKEGNALWENQINPNGKSAYGYDLQISKDGNSYLLGGAEEYNQGLQEALIIRVDLNGNLMQIGTKNSVNYRVNNADLSVKSILEDLNSGFVWAGTTNNDFITGVAPAGSPLLVKMNSDGNLFDRVDKTDPRINKNIGGLNELEMVSANQFKKTSDGYIVVGSSIKNGNSDAYLLKIDDSFNIVWYKPFNVSGNEYGNAVDLTVDGGFVVTGRKDISFSGNLTTSNTDVFVIKTDANGNVMWSKDFGGDGADFGTDIKQTNDGGYAVLCSMSLITSPQNKFQMALIKINSEGIIEN